MEEKPQEKILKSVENLVNSDRVINFSDSVFAFAATLLVLKVDLPALAPSQLTTEGITQALLNLWPQYFANIFSFLIIGYYWLTHHAIFALIKRFNPIIIWLNIIFLVFLSFIPFPVDLFGDYSNSTPIHIFYSFSISFVGFLLALIWIYASTKQGLVEQNLTKHQIFYYSLRFLLAPAVFALSIPIAMIDLWLSKLSWLFVLVGILLINKMFHYKKLSILEKELI